MTIAIGADHAGFVLKEQLREMLEAAGHQVIDQGTHSRDSCDYPDFAFRVAEDVACGRAERGILVCSTGAGMCIAANKVPGVRAVVGVSADQVRLTRAHNDVNLLALGSRYLDFAEAQHLVETFLSASFNGGRHSRRLEKIAARERDSGMLEEKSQ
ncbi:MAG: ribose 5-phosphate isomerase B [Rhodospirillales bacterium]